MKWIKLAIISALSFFLDAKETELISTFSIVARDSQTGEWGVAVQSKLVAVGAIVPFAEAGVGAIATQAWGNPNFGPLGLKLLKSGKNAQTTLNLMIDADPRRSHRQLAIIGQEGYASIHTGKNCLDWAGHKSGPGYAVQGNLLAGPEVIQAMAEAFEDSKGTLAEKMITALREAQKMGGDRRGRQAAALLLVRKGWGYGGLNDRFRDLRVDDHTEPIEELDRIYQIHRAMFPRPDEK